MDSNVKILSWNINGIRSLKTNFKDVLDDCGADIICFQETKITRDQLEESLAIVDGYYSFFSFSRKKSGYSGVATYCKKDSIPCFSQEGLSGCMDAGYLKKGSGTVGSLPLCWNNRILKDLDSEGRCIITQHPFQDSNGSEAVLTVINVYCPRADPDRPERAVFKLAFFELLRQRVLALTNAGCHVVVAGDLNISHRRIDHCDPDDEEFDQREDRLLFSDFVLERNKISEADKDDVDDFDLLSPDAEFKSSSKTPTFKDSEGFAVLNEFAFSCEEELVASNKEKELMVNDVRLIDTFRYFYPDRREAFTCWNTKVNARATNYGTRIDYVLCDKGLLPYLEDSFIHPEVAGSDHCPVSVDLKLKLFADHPLPSLCTKFYPEFHGSQQKLSSYFKCGINAKTLDIGTNSSENQIDNGSHFETELPKRRKSQSENEIGAVKRKRIGFKQTSLNTYFIKESNSVCDESGSREVTELLQVESLKEGKSAPLEGPIGGELPEPAGTLSKGRGGEEGIQETLSNDKDTRKLEQGDVKRSRNSSWNFMMRGPAPPPLCSGHKEPSVLRTVKKKGPNLNKQFYSCARGVGKEGDPNSRCNFFKWVDKKPK